MFNLYKHEGIFLLFQNTISYISGLGIWQKGDAGILASTDYLQIENGRNHLPRTRGIRGLVHRRWIDSMTSGEELIAMLHKKKMIFVVATIVMLVMMPALVAEAKGKPKLTTKSKTLTVGTSSSITLKNAEITFA